MDTINNDLTNLLQQMGVHQESLGITQRIIIIAGIIIIAFVADYFCRKIVVPTIKKLTAKTQATWDDYLFNDVVLDNICHLIPPVILYALLPFAFPHEPVTLTFILKLCWVYITAVSMRLICSFLTSLYTISSEHEKLKNHPLNLKRIAEGKDPANSIWPWSPGYRPQMSTFSETFPQVKKGAVISAVDLINGIGYYAGLRRIAVEGATGLYNTNYENKVAAALEALKTDDFVYLHIEASDEAGHEGDIDLKLLTIENLDKRAVGPIYEAVKDWDEPVAIAVLPDHPTPCELRTHTSDPIPFLIWYPGIEPDEVQTYDEVSACNGSYGVLKEDEFIKEFMK